MLPRRLWKSSLQEAWECAEAVAQSLAITGFGGFRDVGIRGLVFGGLGLRILGLGTLNLWYTWRAKGTCKCAQESYAPCNDPSFTLSDLLAKPP